MTESEHEDLEDILTEITPLIQDAIYRVPGKRDRVSVIMHIASQVFLDDAIDPKYRDQVGWETSNKIATAMLNGAVWSLDEMAGIERGPDGTGKFTEDA